MDNLRQIEKKADGRAACDEQAWSDSGDSTLQLLEKASGAGECQPDVMAQDPTYCARSGQQTIQKMSGSVAKGDVRLGMFLRTLMK